MRQYLCNFPFVQHHSGNCNSVITAAVYVIPHFHRMTAHFYVQLSSEKKLSVNRKIHIPLKIVFRIEKNTFMKLLLQGSKMLFNQAPDIFPSLHSLISPKVAFIDIWFASRHY